MLAYSLFSLHNNKGLYECKKGGHFCLAFSSSLSKYGIYDY